MNKGSGSNAGFTLVEVLIAAVIMFSLLATAALVFKSARQSSQQAADVVVLLTPLPLVVDTIREQIRQNPLPELNGDGKVENVSYSWAATAVMFLPPPEQVLIETMQNIRYKPRFYLYEVQLKLQYGRRIREFTFKELAWLPQAEVE